MRRPSAAPTLLLIVTLLFAVTWSRDSQLPAPRCAVARISPEKSREIPLERPLAARLDRSR